MFGDTPRARAISALDRPCATSSATSRSAALRVIARLETLLEDTQRRAEEESRRAEEESRRAEEESRRAEAAEAELARLRQELARLKK